MDSECPSPPVVNEFDEKLADNLAGGTGEFPRELPEIECEALCRRFEGYLRGWFANRCPQILAAELKRRFHRRTKLSWRHIDDIFPRFQAWTTNFTFTKTRLGRSTCIVITPRNRRVILTRAEVRRRLVGAICKHVEKSGGVHVDRKFLEKFHSMTGLPPEYIFYAWRTIRRIEGMNCRWRGRGNGVNLHVQTPCAAQNSTAKRQKAGKISHPENASGISPLRGNRSENRRFAHPIPGEIERLASQATGGLGEGSATGSARPPGTLRDGADDVETTHGADVQTAPTCAPPPGGACKPAKMTGEIYRWEPVLPPLHVCNRYVSTAKLRKKANFLVFGPFLHAHTKFFRVRWRVSHARNFAEAALRSGFLDSKICAAYSLGLDAAHASAKAEWQEDIGADGIREPSQAVSVAWKNLREDPRTDEDRWAAIFRGDVAPGLRGTVGAAAAAGAVAWPEKPAAAAAPGRAEATDPAPAREVLSYSFEAPKTFEQHLKDRGLTLAELLKRPRAEQQKFVREAQAAHRQNPQNGDLAE